MTFEGNHYNKKGYKISALSTICKISTRQSLKRKKIKIDINVDREI